MRPITLMFYDDGSRTRPNRPASRPVRTRDEEAPEQRHPMFAHDPEVAGNTKSNGNAKAMPDGDPSSTTRGGAAPAGLRTDLLASYPTERKWSYWPTRTPQGTEVWRRDMQSTNDPVKVGGPFAVGTDAYHHFDQNATHFTLWQTSRPLAVLNAAGSSRGAANDASGQVQINFPPDWTERQIRNALEQMVQLQQSEMNFGSPRLNSQRFERELEGKDGAMGVSSEPWENGGKRDDTGSEASRGVGAESWVGGKKNSTGYRITTGDAARPGLAHGRRNASLVAARVSVLASMNRANALAWQRG